MEIRTTTFLQRGKEVYVLPSSSTFTIKHSEIPKLVVYFAWVYIKALFM